MPRKIIDAAFIALHERDYEQFDNLVGLMQVAAKTSSLPSNFQNKLSEVKAEIERLS